MGIMSALPITMPGEIFGACSPDYCTSYLCARLSTVKNDDPPKYFGFRPVSDDVGSSIWVLVGAHVPPVEKGGGREKLPRLDVRTREVSPCLVHSVLMETVVQAVQVDGDLVARYGQELNQA